MSWFVAKVVSSAKQKIMAQRDGEFHNRSTRGEKVCIAGSGPKMLLLLFIPAPWSLS